MKTLSLCMIVRDEAEMLPRFLSACEGLYDELCIVDTGSTDETPALCKQAGAKLESFVWQDDFSLARNRSLEMATCDRILVLDADEMVTPAFIASMRALLEDDSIGAATVTMGNALPHGHRKQSHLLRMFRNTPNVRFSHRIHEDVTTAVVADLADNGLRLGHIGAEIEHLGYSEERALARNKQERDTNLLWQCIQEDPSDFYSWHKLLEQGQFWNDLDLSEQAAEGIEQLLEECDAVPPGCQHFFGAMVVALAHLRMPYEEPAAIALIERWSERLPDDAALVFCRGQLREGAGALALAEADYLHCLTLRDTTFDVQLVTTRPQLGLARLAIARNQIEVALNYVEQALARHPRDPEALLALASLGRAMGGAQGAARVAEVYTDAYGEVAEMHAAWGEAALLDGDDQDARSHFEEACRLSPATVAYATKLDQLNCAPPSA